MGAVGPGTAEDLDAPDVRRRRVVLAVAFTAAVLIALGLTAVDAWRGDDSVPTPSPPTPTGAIAPSTTSVTAPEVPGGYRAEYWHDVVVYVPATWGWGSAPATDLATGETLLCGRQVVQADGSRRTRPGLPYVGRPVALSERCDAGWATARPRAPYVWLGGDVPTGTVDLGGGWVRETVEVADATVSVASDDEALRQAILGSAHAVAGHCEPQLGNPPTPDGTMAAGFAPVSMLVCAYAPTSTHLDFSLVYEQELTTGPAKQLVAAVDAAAPAGSLSCFAPQGGEWVLLHLLGNDGSHRDYSVDLSCPTIADPSGSQHLLGRHTVAPWAVGGVNAVLHRPPQVDVGPRLVPVLG